MRMELRPRALDKLYKRRDRIEVPDWQRGEVWSIKKKQKLLDTILKGWHMPVIYFRKIGDEAFECVDGQQRLTTVWEFFENKIPLSEESQRIYGGPFYKGPKRNLSTNLRHSGQSFTVQQLFNPL